MKSVHSTNDGQTVILLLCLFGLLYFIYFGGFLQRCLSPPDEWHKAPKRRAEYQNDAKYTEDRSVAADLLVNYTANGWPHQLNDAVDEQRDAVGRGELLRSQHVGHDDGGDADVDAGREAEEGAVNGQHDVHVGGW